jgi:hypothetical protein
VCFRANDAAELRATASSAGLAVHRATAWDRIATLRVFVGGGDMAGVFFDFDQKSASRQFEF